MKDLEFSAPKHSRAVKIGAVVLAVLVVGGGLAVWHWVRTDAKVEDLASGVPSGEDELEHSDQQVSDGVNFGGEFDIPKDEDNNGQAEEEPKASAPDEQPKPEPEPVQPSQPTQPSQPIQPSQPVQPSEPTEPSQPVQPTPPIKKPQPEKKTLVKVTLNANGATISQSNLTCEKSGASCKVKLPSISRGGWEVLGWAETKDAKVAKYKVGQEVDVKKDQALYAVTRKKITVNFETNGAESAEYTKKECAYYNTEAVKACRVRVPVINKVGKLAFGFDVKGKAGEYPTYLINNEYDFKADTTLVANYNEMNKHYRNISVYRTIKYGRVTIEIDDRCAMKERYVELVAQINNSGFRFLFNGPSKVTILAPDTFRNIYGSTIAGTTVGNGGYDRFPASDVLCSATEDNVLVHELTHKWDKEYMLKYGDFIAHQDDVLSLYNKYKNMSSRPLSDYAYTSEYEFFAEMTKFYFQKYVQGQTSMARMVYPDDIRRVMEKYIRAGI